MKYLLEIPLNLGNEINKHVRSGKYRSPHDFILVALQNQLANESRDEGWVEAETAQFPDISTSPTPARSTMQLLQLSPEAGEPRTVPLSDVARPGYLWGQYNRIFPVKIVTRVAGNLARTEGREYFQLSDLHEKAAEIARDLGRIIERAEKSMGRKRGEIISAALPIGRGSRADKGKLRFKNQFVGNMGKGKIEGAAAAFGFIDFCKDDKNSVLAGITDFGLRFASLWNPVIDGRDYSAPFSSEEVHFLLNHIVAQMPEESKLMMLILSGIKEGIATPEGLNSRMGSANPEWNEGKASTMRGGVVSRLSELGLLERRKNGVKVTYQLTELGEEYLGKLKVQEV